VARPDETDEAKKARERDENVNVITTRPGLSVCIALIREARARATTRSRLTAMILAARYGGPDLGPVHEPIDP
jgi:hypothetical protein